MSASPPPDPQEGERPFPPDPAGPDAPGPEGVPEAEAEAYDPASESGRVYDAPPRGGGVAEGDRVLASLCHLAGLSWMLGAFVLGPLVPLAVWYFARRDDALVERHAKEACNFQLSMLFALAAGIAMSFTCVLAVIGIPLALGATVLSLVMPVVAAVRTSNGEDYRYPLTYRFLV